MSRTLRLIAVSALTASVALTAVSAAEAAPTKRAKKPAPIIATANGTVGISQPLTVQAPTLAGQTVSVSFALNGVVQSTAPVALNGQGGGTLTWTPSAAGAWTVDGVGTLAPAPALTVSAAAVPTRTVLSTVNIAQVGIPTTMVVTVETTGGNSDPQGTVTITNGSGTTYGVVTLAGVGGGSSEGTFLWTPPSPALYPFIATYTPSAGAGGVANTTGSSSGDQIEVVTTQPLVTLRLPSVFTQGDPVTLTALVNQPNLGGSAAFSTFANGTTTYLSPSIPNVLGVSNFTWTPTILGNQFMTANFSSSTTPVVSGVNQQAIVVQPQGGADPMSVQASGYGVLKTNTPVTVKAGSRTTLSASSGSGATVNLAESGPCLLSGATLIAPSGNGICTLTASSPGGGQFSGNSATFAFYYGNAR